MVTVTAVIVIPIIGMDLTGKVECEVFMVGLPAKQVGWMSQQGEKLNLPLTGNGQAVCPTTGVCYFLQNGALTAEET